MEGDTIYHDCNLYSRTQQLVLVILPYISAPLSSIGSALIMYVIIATDIKRARKQLRTYHRLMLGMSFLDFWTSAGLAVVGHWAVPADTMFVVGAAGNDKTCAISYYFLHGVFGSMWYSAFLAIYFMLVVRFDWPEQRIARWVEPFAHFAAFVSTVAVPIEAHALQDVHPIYLLPGFCATVNSKPITCASAEDAPDIAETDPRSLGSTLLEDGILIIGLFGVIIVCMILIVGQVRKADQYVQRYEHTVEHAADDGRDEHGRRNKEIAREALLYIAAFFVVFSPALVLMYAPPIPESTSRNRRVYFAFAFLTKLLTPLQGWFNAIIFLRRRFSSIAEDSHDRNMSIGMFVAYLNHHTTEQTVVDGHRQQPNGENEARSPA